MANAGTLVAHLFKLIVTLVCMKNYSYKIFANKNDWAARAFEILLAHSLLGVLTFGTSPNLTGKRFLREIYDSFTNIIGIVPFALLTTEISIRCYVSELLRQLLLATLVILPIVHEFIRKKDRTKIRRLTNLVVAAQLLTIVFAGLKRGFSNVLSFVLSYTLDRYFLEDLCERIDVPYVDFAQYSLCFVEIFAILCIREL